MMIGVLVGVCGGKKCFYTRGTVWSDQMYGTVGKRKNTLVGLNALGEEPEGELVPLSHPVGIAFAH